MKLKTEDVQKYEEKKVGPGARQNTTRDKIIMAARKVFAEHPFHMATVRMVGKAGGFDHQLIAYYFPTKADLFEAVVASTCKEFYLANRNWFEGLDKLGFRESFSVYLDRMLEYNDTNPEPLRIMALNSALIERLDEIPGYQRILEVLANTRATFEESVPLTASPEDIGRFITTYNTAIINYLGAAPAQAELLGMDPKSREYRDWVKDTLMFVFLPALGRLIFGDRP